MLRKSRSGKILVKGELSYNIDTGRERIICKSGKMFDKVHPKPILIVYCVKVKAEKVKDIEKLRTKHFGHE